MKLKLHAVSPGGPPEGHCNKEQEVVCYTNFDEPFSYSMHRAGLPKAAIYPPAKLAVKTLQYSERFDHGPHANKLA
jgi:hypothetical protein